jgi:hypothetical protein
VPTAKAATVAHSTTAAVAESSSDKFILSVPIVKIVKVANSVCSVSALMDTGSPVSFISLSNFRKLFGLTEKALEPVTEKFNALPKTPIDILGKFNSTIVFEYFPDRNFTIALHVIATDFSDIDMIIGRDLMDNHNLTLIYNAGRASLDSFTSRLPQPNVYFAETVTETIIDDCEIDYDLSDKLALKNIILSCENRVAPVINDDFYVRVKLKDTSTYAYAPRKFAYSERQKMREIIDDLLGRGIIKISTSPYCARIVPVRKKNGELRLCVDLRPLNARIDKQKYPFPVIEDCLARLGNKSVFTLLDLKDGFHQIKVHPEDTKYFAFATPDGQYEFTKLPFGYSEAPAEFQKRIVQVLQPLIRQDKVIVYIDDIVIATDSVKENLEVIEEVLSILKSYNFELNYFKCQFLKKQIEYLGYIISPGKITMSDRHTAAVKAFPVPRNVHQVRRFLGLTNFFRKFVQNYACIAKPLNNLLKKSVDFCFDKDCVKAFEKLKSELTAYPILRLYSPAAQTELHTDASSQGLGAILLQKQTDGNWAPIAYYSQATNKAEANYHSFELEMLAIVRAIERFHIYLYGLEFKVITDCNALTYAINKANLNPRIARWTLLLQNYCFKVEHRPGKRMTHVDALSRQIYYLEALPVERELEFRQLQDARLKEIAVSLEYGESDLANKFELIDGLVYRKSLDRARFAIPESMVNNIIRRYHDELAHCGLEKTFQGIHETYWFPSMRKRIRDYIENCVTCLMADSSAHRFEGQMQIEPLPKALFERIHVNHCGPLQETSDSHKYIFAVVDAYTRYTWLFATKSTGTKEVVNHLKFLFNVFDKPTEIVSDRGSAFMSIEF